MNRLRAAALLTAGLTVVVGCAPVGGDAVLIRVEDRGMSGALAAPASVEVPVGGEVRWNNFGARLHTVTGGQVPGDLAARENVAVQWGPERLGPGETLSHVFDEPGVYVYWFGEDTTAGVIVVEPTS